MSAAASIHLYLRQCMGKWVSIVRPIVTFSNVEPAVLM